MNWSDWLPLSTGSDYYKPAVYQIRLVGNGVPFSFSRMLGGDPHAILAIGQTEKMEVRRKTIRRKQFACGVEKCYGHSAANLLYLLMNYSRLKEHVNAPSVEYSFAKCGSAKLAVDREAAMLRSYFIRHGELPPLNSILPDRYGSKVPWPRIE
jgi:hypothetical protein